jgi:hypothetical protein
VAAVAAVQIHPAIIQVQVEAAELPVIAQVVVAAAKTVAPPAKAETQAVRATRAATAKAALPVAALPVAAPPQAKEAILRTPQMLRAAVAVAVAHMASVILQQFS